MPVRSTKPRAEADLVIEAVPGGNGIEDRDFTMLAPRSAVPSTISLEHFVAGVTEIASRDLSRRKKCSGA